LTLISCESDTSRQDPLFGLRKLSHQEMVERARGNNHPDINTVRYFNQHGTRITRDSINKLVYTNFAYDDYVDANGIVTTTVIRPIDEAYKQLIKQMDAAFEQGFPLKTVYIACENIGPLLDSIRIEDQKHRMGGGQIDLKVDHSNLEVIISLIEKCGMPTSENISKEQILTIWLVIQHSKLKHMKKYLPILKEAASKGDLNQRNIAMMEDRILLHEGKAQIYGTQVCFSDSLKKYLLCQPVHNAAEINTRRAKIGFGPIEDYLNSFN
jgi:hypothetical protein